MNLVNLMFFRTYEFEIKFKASKLGNYTIK